MRFTERLQTAKLNHLSRAIGLMYELRLAGDRELVRYVVKKETGGPLLWLAFGMDVVRRSFPFPLTRRTLVQNPRPPEVVGYLAIHLDRFTKILLFCCDPDQNRQR
jgi:hypothetical protein